MNGWVRLIVLVNMMASMIASNGAKLDKMNVPELIKTVIEGKIVDKEKINSMATKIGDKKIVRTEYGSGMERIPYKKIYQKTDALKAGVEEVSQKGEYGKLVIKVKHLIGENNLTLDTIVIDQKVEIEPKDEIILVGTKVEENSSTSTEVKITTEEVKANDVIVTTEEKVESTIVTENVATTNN